MPGAAELQTQIVDSQLGGGGDESLAVITMINPEDLAGEAERRAARKPAKRAGQLQIPGVEMDR
jgi:hypothetical protein